MSTKSRTILAWVFGIFILLMSLSALTRQPIAGLMIAAAGALLLPPVAKRVSDRLAGKWRITIAVVLLLIGIGASGSSQQLQQQQTVTQNQTTSQPTTPPPAPTPTPTTVNKDVAEKELKDFMDLGIKANLVDSYDFSDSATVVYVSPVWYTQTVAFKKDFLAKTAMLKKAVTGYGHLEVRDSHSNEKVAEVTAFSQSLEVYK